MPRTPTLQLHKATGVHFTRWANRDHYFTIDPRESERLFLAPDSDHPGSLRAWQSWASARASARRPPGGGPAPTATSNGAPVQARPRTVGERLTVAELARSMLAAYYDEGRTGAESYFRRSLKRFLNTFGALFVDELEEPAFDAFKTALVRLKLGPKTIAHDLNAAKHLWRWGAHPARRLCRPLSLEGIKGPRIPRSVPEDISIPEVRRRIRRAAKLYPYLEAWLSLNYLCLLRPSEVVRLAARQGRVRPLPRDGSGVGGAPVKAGMAVLTEHKMSWKVAHDRIILLSDEALPWLTALAPLPRERRRRSVPTSDIRHPTSHIAHEQGRYAALCAAAGVPGLPHILRDSAATHLLEDGVAQADVDLLLGHGPIGELGRYGRTALRLLRASASRLTLR